MTDTPNKTPTRKKVRISDGQRNYRSEISISRLDDKTYGLDINGKVKSSLEKTGSIIIGGAIYYSPNHDLSSQDNGTYPFEVDSINGQLFNGPTPEMLRIGDITVYSTEKAAMEARHAESVSEPSGLERQSEGYEGHIPADSLAEELTGKQHASEKNSEFVISALYAQLLQTAQEKEELSGKVEETAKEYEKKLEGKDQEHQKELTAQREMIEGKHIKHELELERQARELDEKVKGYESQIKQYKERIEEQGLRMQALSEEFAKARKFIDNYDALLSEIAGMDRDAPLKEKVAAARNSMVELRGLRKRVKDLEAEIGTVEEIYVSPEDEIAPESPVSEYTADNTGMPKSNNDSKNSQQKPDDINSATRYIMLKLYKRNSGNEESVLTELNEIFEGFERLEPEEKGLTQKDMKILREFYSIKCQEMSQYALMDPSMAVPIIVDNELKPMLKGMEIPSERVSLEQRLMPAYESYPNQETES